MKSQVHWRIFYVDFYHSAQPPLSASTVQPAASTPTGLCGRRRRTYGMGHGPSAGKPMYRVQLPSSEAFGSYYGHSYAPPCSVERSWLVSPATPSVHFSGPSPKNRSIFGVYLVPGAAHSSLRLRVLLYPTSYAWLESAPSTGPRFLWIGWCSLDFQWRGERCCRDRNWRHSKRNLQLKLMFFFPRDLKRAQMGKSGERKKTFPVQKNAN